jgi:general secretion pathway protein B
VSFILDALRKSEHERERRALPALVERGAGAAASSRLPLVLGALGVLLLANLVVLAIYLLRPAPLPPSAPAAVALVAAPFASSAPRPAVAGTAPHTRPLEAEAGEATGPALDTPEPPPRARAEPALVSPLASARWPPATERPPASAPSLNELPEVSASGLPHLSLELHVYASAPSDRFVVMNGQRLREGASLREGPVLERITPDGVILNYRGMRFQLPRQ